MTTNLWSENKVKKFWQCHQTFDDGLWEYAVQKTLSILQLRQSPLDEDDLLMLVLGEGQFGPDHWTLSRFRKLYYILKPILPRPMIRTLRRSLHKRHEFDFQLGWPIEPRYPQFQFNVMKNLLQLSGQSSIQFRPIWPDEKRFAFVLTHDIETNKGQQFVRRVADLEESLGFHSSFNFVPEGYHIDMNLVNELVRRGFEVGIHGLKHDGRLFNSYQKFLAAAQKINHYLNEFEAVGFRAPLTIRNPEWMQALNIEYDLSFFDSDPFEPIPGGTMSIWPFLTGHYVELPYTLVQDYTLTSVLGETTPKIWFDKIEFIEKYHGMALINSHPDYLRDPFCFNIFSEFLHMIRHKENYWHALPREVARWWRSRTFADTAYAGNCIQPAYAVRKGDGIQITNLPNGH